MLSKIKSLLHIASNMGLRYIVFRAKYELEKRIGILQNKFPVNPPFQSFISLSDWKASSTRFFFKGKESLNFHKNPSKELKNAYEKINHGIYPFFNAFDIKLGKNYDWVTHPETHYQYDLTQHSLSIENLNPEAGDIKYVWEKARFSFLYVLMRYDFHFDKNCAPQVFDEIIDFIDKNPLNQGPNYNCSQEISLRIFHWIFALYYYQNSTYLTEEVFDKIVNSIYWQTHHIYQNIHFSRIAVRNNHAITETLALYLVPMLFPTMPHAKKWKNQGKKWFEQEIAYQIYKDGTFLQFSMNYHRVVVQLLTWAIRLSELNGELFDSIVYERAKRSVCFLNACQDDITGHLPNYGSNDGALFFTLSETHYRNYKPQLFALASLLKIDYTGTVNENEKEEKNWLGIEQEAIQISVPKEKTYCFPAGGYYLVREGNTLTFTRCGSYKDRPSQADNLHVDIWVNGINILWDAGSYKYNTTKENINYFNGTASHNTLMIENYNQMQKGDRFIWYHWIKESRAEIQEKEDKYKIIMSYKGFEQLGRNIYHKRTITKKKGQNQWWIKDEITGQFKGKIHINWHLNPKAERKLKITMQNNEGKPLALKKIKSYVSNFYGIKEESINLYAAISERKCLTKISL